MMTPEVAGGLVVMLAFTGKMLAVLAVGGIVADYILPRIRPLRRWLRTLPLWSDED